MWEKFKDWFASDNFPWFMLGWTINEFLTTPSWFNFFFLAFWIWVLNLEE